MHKFWLNWWNLVWVSAVVVILAMVTTWMAWFVLPLLVGIFISHLWHSRHPDTRLARIIVWILVGAIVLGGGSGIALATSPALQTNWETPDLKNTFIMLGLDIVLVCLFLAVALLGFVCSHFVIVRKSAKSNPTRSG